MMSCMTRYAIVFVSTLIMLGCKDTHQQKANRHMNKKSFEALVNTFENPEREKWQKPDEVLALLGNINGKTIMDIGAGTGYFSFKMASRGAQVIAADVDERFSDYIKAKQSEMGIENITTRKTEFSNPLLKPDEIDHAIIVNTYHHIDEREAYFKKVASGLKDEGSLMVVDFKKIDAPVGPPEALKVALDTVIKELKQAGFKHFKIDKEVLPYQYIIAAFEQEPNTITSKQAEMWNTRYSQEEYVYGTSPNVFLKSVLDTLSPGAILLPAEGEGRNAVYAASLGWQVDATDLSEVGKAKAEKLAAEKGVNITYTIADATQFQTDKRYDAIAFVFLHLPPDIRAAAFKQYIPLLKPNGKIIVEVFNKEQLQNTSGGPKSLPMLYTLKELKDIFGELDIIYAEDAVFELDEGAYHKGRASTSRIVVTNH